MENTLLDEYNKWMRQEIKFETYKDFTEITTPFVDMHHDYIQLYFSGDKGQFVLSDDGHIINELEMLGVDIKGSEKRKKYFNTTLKIFGVQYNNETEELYIKFNDVKNYPQSQHKLLQCILRISDMLLTSRNHVSDFFSEDILNFFDDSDVPYVDGAGYEGKSGVTHNFDFTIPRFKKKNAKLIKALNNPNTNKAKETLFAWMDLEYMSDRYDLLIIANDENKKISPSFIQMFTNYDIEVFEWSNRNNWVNQLKII